MNIFLQFPCTTTWIRLRLLLGFIQKLNGWFATKGNWSAVYCVSWLPLVDHNMVLISFCRFAILDLIPVPWFTQVYRRPYSTSNGWYCVCIVWCVFLCIVCFCNSHVKNILAVFDSLSLLSSDFIDQWNGMTLLELHLKYYSM